MPMRVIIAGGRDFNDYNFLREKCTECLDLCCPDYEIVSGGAGGADWLGERFALEHDYPIKVFQADWGKHGKSAGPIRNKEMAIYAHVLIAFWDGKSKGTKDMIAQAKKQGLFIYIFSY